MEANIYYTGKLLTGAELLAAVFGEANPPSTRWLRNMVRRRIIPVVKIGRLARYDADAVRTALRKNCTVQARGCAMN